MTQDKVEIFYPSKLSEKSDDRFSTHIDQFNKLGVYGVIALQDIFEYEDRVTFYVLRVKNGQRYGCRFPLAPKDISEEKIEELADDFKQYFRENSLEVSPTIDIKQEPINDKYVSFQIMFDIDGSNHGFATKLSNTEIKANPAIAGEKMLLDLYRSVKAFNINTQDENIVI